MRPQNPVFQRSDASAREAGSHAVAPASKRAADPLDCRFDERAGHYLRVMPTLMRWNKSHHYITEKTILNRLLPRFGGMRLSQIDQRELDKFEQELWTVPSRKTGRPLGFSRVVSIMRLLRQILESDEVHHCSDRQAREMQLPETRQESDLADWRANFEGFKEEWAKRSSDEIYRGHPQESWVNRQRKQFRKGTMPAWKHKLLLEINFPFEPASAASQGTDMSHAHALLAFFREHGHTAPSITVGGGALTHWVRRMRESQGASGIKGATPGLAKAAEQWLMTQIPGFDWKDTSKATINRECGLTHNGYEPSRPAPRTGDRRQEIMERAQASRQPDQVQGNRVGLPPDLSRLLQRAWYYEQAVRVTLPFEGPESTQHWRLSAVHPVPGTMLVELLLKPWPNGEGEGWSVMVEHAGQVADYSPDGAYYCMKLNLVGSTTAGAALLDYDVCLADQTHRGDHPFSWLYRTRPVHEHTVHWAQWCSHHTFPVKAAGTQTTANVHFEKNLADLKEFIAQESADIPGRSVHIVWNPENLQLFKFIEHMVRKAGQGVYQPSHIERLAQLPFTWGAKKQTPRDLFMSRWLRRDNCRPMRSAPSLIARQFSVKVLGEETHADEQVATQKRLAYGLIQLISQDGDQYPGQPVVSMLARRINLMALRHYRRGRWTVVKQGDVFMEAFAGAHVTKSGLSFAGLNASTGALFNELNHASLKVWARGGMCQTAQGKNFSIRLL